MLFIFFGIKKSIEAVTGFKRYFVPDFFYFKLVGWSGEGLVDFFKIKRAIVR